MSNTKSGSPTPETPTRYNNKLLPDPDGPVIYFTTHQDIVSKLERENTALRSELDRALSEAIVHADRLTVALRMLIRHVPEPMVQSEFATEIKRMQALTTFQPYGKIPVIAASGESKDRDHDKLEAGDEIAEDFAKQVTTDVREVIDNRAEIHKAFSSIKSSMTRVQSRLPLRP